MSASSGASPDVVLGPGDTAPATKIELHEPDNVDGSQGDTLDLTGFRSLTLKFQPRNGSSAVVANTTATSSLQSGPTTNKGIVQIDWLLVAGLLAGTNYRFRVIVVTADGRQRTYPARENVDLPDGTNPSWYWLQVEDDFPAPPS